RLAPAEEEDLLFPLREADERKLAEADRLQRGMRGVELALPAVDDDEIGERLLFFHTTREIARHDFVHRREVVDAFHRLHLELAVLGAVRPPVLEPDARRHGV